LHDPQCIYKFKEHDIYLILPVIDDLDEIKTRRESVGWSSREVFRILEQFSLRDMVKKGVVVNDEGGRLYVYNTEIPNKAIDTPNITRVNSDNAIINAAMSLKSQQPKRRVIIVSKDMALRVRAQAWQCEAENYRSDLLDDDSFCGIRYVTLDDYKDLEFIYQNIEFDINSASESLIKSLKNHLAPNEYVIFSCGDKKAITKFNNNKLTLIKDKSNGGGKPVFMGISANNLEQRCAIDALADDNISLVNLSGPAGTGKTVLALAVSLQKVMDGLYDKLVIMKPIVPVSGRDLGALPGDKMEKLYNWFSPYKDNIQILTHNKFNSGITLEDLVADDKIEMEAMTYIQGRSIPNSIIIVDESENISPREARMVVERCGKNSRVILLGDLSQVENPYLDSRSCGLAHSINGSRWMNMCAAVALTKVERSALAAIASDIL
jgi:PhoH-like ATPase